MLKPTNEVKASGKIDTLRNKQIEKLHQRQAWAEAGGDAAVGGKGRAALRRLVDPGLGVGRGLGGG